MTREEKQKAINALKISTPVMAMRQERLNDYIQTLNKIMDWLEQEPTTKNNLEVDCISRVKAIEEINSVANDAWDEEQMRVDLIAEINALPSVTPIRPKGYWRNVDTNMYACSKCSHVLTINTLDNSISEMNTCPFCSADMRKVEE